MDDTFVHISGSMYISENLLESMTRSSVVQVVIVEMNGKLVIVDMKNVPKKKRGTRLIALGTTYKTKDGKLLLEITGMSTASRAILKEQGAEIFEEVQSVNQGVSAEPDTSNLLIRIGQTLCTYKWDVLHRLVSSGLNVMKVGALIVGVGATFTGWTLQSVLSSMTDSAAREKDDPPSKRSQKRRLRDAPQVRFLREANWTDEDIRAACGNANIFKGDVGAMKGLFRAEGSIASLSSEQNQNVIEFRAVEASPLLWTRTPYRILPCSEHHDVFQVAAHIITEKAISLAQGDRFPDTLTLTESELDWLNSERFQERWLKYWKKIHGSSKEKVLSNTMWYSKSSFLSKNYKEPKRDLWNDFTLKNLKTNEIIETFNQGRSVYYAPHPLVESEEELRMWLTQKFHHTLRYSLGFLTPRLQNALADVLELYLGHKDDAGDEKILVHIDDIFPGEGHTLGYQTWTGWLKSFAQRSPQSNTARKIYVDRSEPTVSRLMPLEAFDESDEEEDEPEFGLFDVANQGSYRGTFDDEDTYTTRLVPLRDLSVYKADRSRWYKLEETMITNDRFIDHLNQQSKRHDSWKDRWRGKRPKDQDIKLNIDIDTRDLRDNHAHTFQTDRIYRPKMSRDPREQDAFVEHVIQKFLMHTFQFTTEEMTLAIQDALHLRKQAKVAHLIPPDVREMQMRGRILKDQRQEEEMHVLEDGQAISWHTFIPYVIKGITEGKGHVLGGRETRSRLLSLYDVQSTAVETSQTSTDDIWESILEGNANLSQEQQDLIRANLLTGS